MAETPSLVRKSKINKDNKCIEIIVFLRCRWTGSGFCLVSILIFEFGACKESVGEEDTDGEQVGDYLRRRHHRYRDPK